MKKKFDWESFITRIIQDSYMFLAGGFMAIAFIMKDIHNYLDIIAALLGSICLIGYLFYRLYENYCDLKKKLREL